MGAKPIRSRPDEGIHIPILFLVLALLLGLVLLPPTLAYGFRWIRSWTTVIIYGLSVMSLLGGVLLSLVKGVRLFRRRRSGSLVIIVLASIWIAAFGYVYVSAVLHAMKQLW